MKQLGLSEQFLALALMIVWAGHVCHFRQLESSKAGECSIGKPKIMVVYKNGVTEKDKKRVRKKLDATVTMTFQDPSIEEVTIRVRKKCISNAMVDKLIKKARGDRSVNSVQLSGSFELH